MSRTAAELAQYLEAKLEGDPQLPLSGVASPEQAGVEDVIYLASPRQRDRAASSRARCIVARPGARIEGKTVLESANPKLAFAKAAAWLLPPQMVTTARTRKQDNIVSDLERFRSTLPVLKYENSRY